jgi:AAA+ superfamily predicted ATPase
MNCIENSCKLLGKIYTKLIVIHFYRKKGVVMDTKYYALSIVWFCTIKGMNNEPLLPRLWEYDNTYADRLIDLRKTIDFPQVRPNATEIKLQKILTQLDAEEISSTLDSSFEALILSNASKKIKNLIKQHALYAASPSTIARRLPTYILLEGPSGFGKSTLAKLIACTAKPKAYFIKGSAFADEYKNSGSHNLRKLFSTLFQLGEQVAVVIDELGALTDRAQEHIDQDMIKEFWMILDESAQKKNVLIVATINELDTLPATLKTRFKGRSYSVESPSRALRIRIVNYHLPEFGYLKRSTKNRLLACASALSIRELEDVLHNAQEYAQIEGTYNNHVNDQNVLDALSDLKKTEKKFQQPLHQRVDKYIPWLLTGIGVVTGIVGIGVSVYMQNKLHNDQLAYNEKNFKIQQELQSQMHIDNQNFQQRLNTDNQKLQQQLHNKQLAAQIIGTVVNIIVQGAMLCHIGKADS